MPHIRLNAVRSLQNVRSTVWNLLLCLVLSTVLVNWNVRRVSRHEIQLIGLVVVVLETIKSSLSVKDSRELCWTCAIWIQIRTLTSIRAMNQRSLLHDRRWATRVRHACHFSGPVVELQVNSFYRILDGRFFYLFILQILMHLTRAVLGPPLGRLSQCLAWTISNAGVALSSWGILLDHVDVHSILILVIPARHHAAICLDTIQLSEQIDALGSWLLINPGSICGRDRVVLIDFVGTRSTQCCLDSLR